MTNRTWLIWGCALSCLLSVLSFGATTYVSIQSLASVSHKWINTISATGVPSATQPDFSDLTGSATCAQLPALTGDVTTSAGACATTNTGGWRLVSTQTASSSASLQWLSLPAANVLWLECSLSVPASTGIAVQVGEGGTPTWETGAHYTGVNNATNLTTYLGNATTTGTDLTDNAFGTGGAAATFVFNLYLYDVASSTLHKQSIYQGAWLSTTPALYNIAGTGYWNNDTTAITSLRIFPSANSITSGSCSLYRAV
jgi:hypothetical protein